MWRGEEIAVATRRDGDSLETEATVMHELGRHLNVLSFYGIATHGSRGTAHLVTELAPHGSLLNVLEKSRKTTKAYSLMSSLP